jgi:hypothetical protein
MEFSRETVDAVTEYAERAGLPAPAREIGDGMDSVVYDTRDPMVAIKMSVSMGGYELIGMQGNPGIVKIFHHKEFQVDDGSLQRFGYGIGETANVLVIWEERLLEAGSGIFGALGIPRRKADEIMEDLEMVNGASVSSLKGGIQSLSRYRAFRSLNKLISTQRWSDMGIRQVGLSRSGQVVLFDNA